MKKGHLGALRGAAFLHKLNPTPNPNLDLTQAKTKGNNVGLGVKYAEKQQRRFQPEKLREGRNIIGLQVMLRGAPGGRIGGGNAGTQPDPPPPKSSPIPRWVPTSLPASKA